MFEGYIVGHSFLIAKPSTSQTEDIKALWGRWKHSWLKWCNEITSVQLEKAQEPDLSVTHLSRILTLACSTLLRMSRGDLFLFQNAPQPRTRARSLPVPRGMTASWHCKNKTRYPFQTELWRVTHKRTQKALFGKDCDLKASGNKGFMIWGIMLGRCLKLNEIFPKGLSPTLGHTEPTR